MHIGMNMMSTLAISSMLEKRFGTLRHAIFILWAVLITSLVYTIVAVLLHLIVGVDSLMYQHSVGFSGVIFAMSVLESNLTPLRSRSVFGFITVPAYLYPWALLIFLQFFMPNLSFVGHLAGILVGTLQLYGVFDPIMVGEAYLQEMDGWRYLSFLASQPNYIPTPVSLDSTNHLRRDATGLRQAITNGVSLVFKFIRDVAETIIVCIFGRGRQSNANIQLPAWGSPSGSSAAGEGVPVDFDDDDDWVGLPPMHQERDPDARIV